MKATKILFFATAVTAGFLVSSEGIASADPPIPNVFTATTESQPSAPNNIPVASLGTCGESFSPTLPGAGEAHWALTCKHGNITVEGWVKDNYSDRECLAVKAHFPGGIWEKSHGVCRGGEIRNFKWTHPGDMADVYLYEYPA